CRRSPSWLAEASVFFRASSRRPEILGGPRRRASRLASLPHVARPVGRRGFVSRRTMTTAIDERGPVVALCTCRGGGPVEASKQSNPLTLSRRQFSVAPASLLSIHA